MPYEIEEAVEAGQIRVAHYDGALAGLLFFETQGFTSTLRYWLIAPEFRSQRFGSGLMHRYFADHPAVRRFLLWVIAANADAIGKYEHYGFAPEGLVDHVLANERIRP
jgi:ribosomal protein S18 acetylase RimI-like enzyme